jgi:ubiquinone/menaquinone biosynthesis C-methylase UbiE
MINELFPVESDLVDLAISDWVFEHIQDPIKFSTEISRVLKKGGFLCTSISQV